MTRFFKLGLTGFPLEHSLSPGIHQGLLKAAGLDGEYRLYPAEDEKKLTYLMSQMRDGEIHGLNVTIPYKQSVIPLLESLTQTAEKIGAVNTVYLEEGQLIGDNTDAAGFMSDLKNSKLWRDEGGTALILGAGGAARAAVYGLKEAGWGVWVAARRLKQAQKLSQNALELTAEEILPHLEDIELIVNATPIGMFPNTNDSPWPEELPFPKHSGVYDMIYNPQDTLLTKQAKEAGLKLMTGLGMLEAQAKFAFEQWTRGAQE